MKSTFESELKKEFIKAGWDKDFVNNPKLFSKNWDDNSAIDFWNIILKAKNIWQSEIADVHRKALEKHDEELIYKINLIRKDSCFTFKEVDELCNNNLPCDNCYDIIKILRLLNGV